MAAKENKIEPASRGRVEKLERERERRRDTEQRRDDYEGVEINFSQCSRERRKET